MSPTLLTVLISFFALAAFAALLSYCVCRVSVQRPGYLLDFAPGTLYGEIRRDMLAKDSLRAAQVAPVDDGPTITINVTKVTNRKYAPYQAALLQQIEALLPITAEEDVETIFSDVLLAYRKLGYNVEDADEIIAQFRKGQHPPVAGSLVNTYA